MKLKDLISNFGECEVPQELIDKFELLKKPKTIWNIEYNDLYNWIDEEGNINTLSWNEDEVDLNLRKAGNAFINYKEAAKEKERREVETLLLKYGGRRWFKKDGDNCHIWLMPDGCIRMGLVFSAPAQGLIYFDSKDEAEKAVEEIGEERIIKTLFEVR